MLHVGFLSKKVFIHKIPIGKLGEFIFIDVMHILYLLFMPRAFFSDIGFVSGEDMLKFIWKR